MKKIKRNTVLYAWVTKTEKKFVELTAKRKGFVSMSEYINHLIKRERTRR